MNTIYDNTFVLGQTSATNFVAGPGIKIDEPSAGTVRIGNDETVLYTGNTAVTAFTVSEPLTNFTEVAFYVAPNYETTVSKIVLPMVGYNTSHIALTYHSVWNGFKGGIQISTEYNNTGMSAFQLISGAWFGWANDAAKTGTYNDAYIHKIIGINRISGSNA